MNKLTPLLLTTVAFCGPLFAQDSEDYDGTWRGSLVNPAGMRFEVQLVLSGTSGTWQVFTNMAPRENPCMGRRHTVTVGERSADLIRIRIDGSKTMLGCQDIRAAFKLIDGKYLEGHFANGQPLKLVRH